jgi:hypothetical protein
MKVALHALHYIHSMHDYNISFKSDNISEMHSFIHFPPSSDVEAYQDALPPKQGNLLTLLSYTYSNACWGSRVGNAVTNGTLLPLFKFHGMSSGIVFKNGGPLGWLAEHQERTSLSSWYSARKGELKTLKTKLSVFLVTNNEFRTLHFRMQK